VASAEADSGSSLQFTQGLRPGLFMFRGCAAVPIVWQAGLYASKRSAREPGSPRQARAACFRGWEEGRGR